eukprot:3939612-Ditylum_brightwellii.AAC.1
MVVPMPWSGRAVYGTGPVLTLGAACVCTVWQCSVLSSPTFCCGISGGVTICLCTGSTSWKMCASCLSAARCASHMRRNGDGGAGFC